MKGEGCARCWSRGICRLILAIVLHVTSAEVMQLEVPKEAPPSVSRRSFAEWTHHAHDVQGSVLTQKLEGMMSSSTFHAGIDPVVKHLDAVSFERRQVELRRMVRKVHFIVKGGR